MSRNFELLQNLGKEVLLDAPAAVAAVDQHRREPVVPQQVESKEPQLKLEPKEREELTKLAQRIFLQPQLYPTNSALYLLLYSPARSMPYPPCP